MAQHDYSLANQSGSAFRSDLNNALAAIVSQNSGSTEPITKYAYQYWIDTSTTPALIKQRNAANSDWLNIGEVDGQTLAAAGTAAKPSISFRADTDTGLRRNAANNISIVTGGADRLVIDSGGNVAIGTTSPEARLQVRADGDEVKAPLYLQNRNGGANAGSQITFSNSTADLADNRSAFIRSLTTGASQNGNHLSFGTNPNGGPPVERVFIKSDGNVGIDTNSPSAKLTVNGSLSKSSGSFKIDHPLPALAETHHLVHSFVEAPDASNLYAGMVDLVDGRATINIDTAHRMTEGTFEALNTIQSWSSSNESGYAPVKCSFSGNLLTIECQDITSTDTVYYEVRGVRKDQHMLDTEWTDENGRVITEPSKAAESNDLEAAG